MHLACLLDKEGSGFDMYEESPLVFSDDDHTTDKYGRALDPKFAARKKERAERNRKRQQDAFDERRNRRIESRKAKKVVTV